MQPHIFWLIATGIFIFIEIITISFLFFWFAIGAFAAFIASILGASMPIQVIIFSVVTIPLIIFTKPLTKKLFKTKSINMNNSSVINKSGIVIKKIDNINNEGQVKISGEIWSAISSDDSIIEENEKVVVEDIIGIRLKVRKI